MTFKRWCDLCGSNQFVILLSLKGPSMLSDRRFVSSSLKKFECKECGLVCGDWNIKKREILEQYTNNYSYNPSVKGDAIFFTTFGIQERSVHIFKWILDEIPNEELKTAKTIIEVGCGEGNLLSKFAKKFPKKKIIGFELNYTARKLGRKKGLDIRKLNELKNVKADIIISYAVIEHTHSPKRFLTNIYNSLNPNGMLILGQPHQDKIYYDIFFLDHLFHFSSKHIEEYGKIANLVQIKKAVGNWPIDNFSLHFFKKSVRKLDDKIVYHKTTVKKSIQYYFRVFIKINRFLENLETNSSLAVFGLGELFSLLFFHTNLKKMKISYGIDDYPPKNFKFPFPVISSKKAKNLKEGPILFCVNKNYYEIVLRKIRKRKNQVFLPLK